MATADELIWQNIGPSSNSGGHNAFCAFKDLYRLILPILSSLSYFPALENFGHLLHRTITQNFCRNAYNVSGLCSRQACPLANSKYATVREQEGALYLFMKTPERAHTPAKMWERVKLSSDYTKALSQIDTELAYWPSFLIHKCKQRTTKIVQYLIKIRKLQTRESGKLVPVKKKLERREAVREGKALTAAQLEKNLEKELISRLKSRTYGDMPLNVNEEVWNAILEKEKLVAEAEGEAELELESDEDELENEDSDLDEEDEDEDEIEREFVEDLEESDVEDLEDFSGEDDEETDDEEDEDEDSEDGMSSKTKGKRKAVQPSKKQAPQKKRRGPQVEIEYEMEGPIRERVTA